MVWTNGIEESVDVEMYVTVAELCTLENAQVIPIRAHWCFRNLSLATFLAPSTSPSQSQPILVKYHELCLHEHSLHFAKDHFQIKGRLEICGAVHAPNAACALHRSRSKV